MKEMIFSKWYSISITAYTENMERYNHISNYMLPQHNIVNITDIVAHPSWPQVYKEDCRCSGSLYSYSEVLRDSQASVYGSFLMRV